MVMEKIRYRLVFNYAGRLNRQGTANVALECRQGKRKIYMKSDVMLHPQQWIGGRVVNHELADKLTAYLVRWKNSVEDVELDMLLKGRSVTLRQLKDSIRHIIRASASLRNFTMSVITCDSSRCKNTKNGYIYLINDITKEYGSSLRRIKHIDIQKLINPIPVLS